MRRFAIPFDPFSCGSPAHALGRRASLSLCPTSEQLNCTESDGWELSFLEFNMWM